MPADTGSAARAALLLISAIAIVALFACSGAPPRRPAEGPPSPGAPPAVSAPSPRGAAAPRPSEIAGTRFLRIRIDGGGAGSRSRRTRCAPGTSTAGWRRKRPGSVSLGAIGDRVRFDGTKTAGERRRRRRPSGTADGEAADRRPGSRHRAERADPGGGRGPAGNLRGRRGQQGIAAAVPPGGAQGPGGRHPDVRRLRHEETQGSRVRRRGERGRPGVRGDRRRRGGVPGRRPGNERPRAAVPAGSPPGPSSIPRAGGAPRPPRTPGGRTCRTSGPLVCEDCSGSPAYRWEYRMSAAEGRRVARAMGIPGGGGSADLRNGADLHRAGGAREDPVGGRRQGNAGGGIPEDRRVLPRAQPVDDDRARRRRDGSSRGGATATASGCASTGRTGWPRPAGGSGRSSRGTTRAPSSAREAP